MKLALAKMRPGGFLLVDNVLWDGKVAIGSTQDPTAQVLRDFNELVQQDNRVEKHSPAHSRRYYGWCVNFNVCQLFVF